MTFLVKAGNCKIPCFHFVYPLYTKSICSNPSVGTISLSLSLSLYLYIYIYTIQKSEWTPSKSKKLTFLNKATNCNFSRFHFVYPLHIKSIYSNPSGCRISRSLSISLSLSYIYIYIYVYAYTRSEWSTLKFHNIHLFDQSMRLYIFVISFCIPPPYKINIFEPD